MRCIECDDILSDDEVEVCDYCLEEENSFQEAENQELLEADRRRDEENYRRMDNE